MLKKIIFPVLIALVAAIAVGTYLLTVNSVDISSEETVVEIQPGVRVIRFTDADGNPVSGVMAKVCDDAACTMITSGEDGSALFEGEGNAWEVQILSAPAGFTFDPDAVFPLAEADETVIALEKE